MKSMQSTRIMKLRSSYGEFDNYETYIDAQKKYDMFKGKIHLFGQ